MGIRAMKFDLFVLKAIEKKGYTVETLMELSDEELDNLNLPDKIITQIKEYKLRGGKTPQQVAEELAAIMEADSETNMQPEEVIDSYRTFTVDVPDIQTSEDAEAFIERVKEELGDKVLEKEEIESESTEEAKPDEVEIIRTIAKDEDIKIIKDVLAKKELRSFASYTKLLKSEVPEAILSAVESTTITSLIDSRIAEIKDKSTK